MSYNYVAPEYQGEAFTCPFCGVYAKFDWFRALKEEFHSFGGGTYYDADISEGVCQNCSKSTIWLNTELLMIWPDNAGTAPLPNPDMPEHIKEDYLEAKSICNKSPRGAAALLRLCIEKLCIHLGKQGKDLNDNIGKLVEDGLPVRIQKALDIVRITGNDYVHPGVMQIDDDAKMVSALFHLVNVIVDDRITTENSIDEIYSIIPESKINGIENRDRSATKGEEATT